ncbi:unnamed protein product [Rotaria sp. Silwood2]|nr:unnamed protein product [Rotaria sp. Silwood2]CAF2642407.1 unnamed protein product [Rotaria sp. Silwood2]CAF2867226.1 unnamed protein product [Rotaria sp. Silwood2]CAF2976479.1 unnamed protein product [Rotaria sp. Silwood2]CAF4312729.1 unnamed protein product [Rotaria sp. Silwood2]
MAFRFGIPNIAFRKRMSWFDFTLACIIGVIGGIYTFKPALKDAKGAIERREALKEIQARRQAEVEKGNHSPPIINQRQPENAREQFLREQKPGQTAWLTTFKRLLKVPNTRYAFLWLTAGTLFCLCIKPGLRRRDEELMIKDVKNYLENKKDLP